MDNQLKANVAKEEAQEEEKQTIDEIPTPEPAKEEVSEQQKHLKTSLQLYEQ